jgi:signal transduction histidine kinase
LDIRGLAERALRGIETKASAKGVEARLEAAMKIPLVQGDPARLQWALNQLLDNAVKFTQPGGHVDISLQVESSNLVMISVRDTGIGIPAKRLKEIFEPFHQLDESSRRHASGAGIGLTIVRQIVEAHGSVLDVSSAEGEGTTFRFPLLVAAAKETAAGAHGS